MSVSHLNISQISLDIRKIGKIIYDCAKYQLTPNDRYVRVKHANVLHKYKNLSKHWLHNTSASHIITIENLIIDIQELDMLNNDVECEHIDKMRALLVVLLEHMKEEQRKIDDDK